MPASDLMADNEALPEQSARLTLFPMMARANMTLTAMFIGQVLPWRSPAVFGARGHAADDPTIQQTVVVFEWPIPQWTVLGDELPKETVERLHLERYCTDRLFATGQLPYERLVVGGNPPDFAAERHDGTTVGVDATQLTAGGRIAAQAQFERIRRAVLARPRAEFGHLRGYLLYLWFRTEGDLGLPHRESEAVEEVMAGLRGYQPDTSWSELPPALTEMPEQLGDTDMQSTGAGCTFYAAPLEAAFPSTTFFARTGFEMALAFQTEHAADAAWTELVRLVDRHDKPEIQDLIVTVGGPNRRGVSYPSESLLLDIALEGGPPVLAPTHLQSVVIHVWTDGRTIEVYPKNAATPRLFPGGYVVPHYSLAPPPEVSATFESQDAPDTV